MDGSLEHSSVFLHYSSVRVCLSHRPALFLTVAIYCGQTGQAARDDMTWNNAVAAEPAIQTVIDSLAYLDDDFQVMYSRGPNMTVQFNNSIQIMNSDNSYYAVHRTYPGIEKNEPDYNPPGRGWFTHAPEGYFYMQ